MAFSLLLKRGLLRSFRFFLSSDFPIMVMDRKNHTVSCFLISYLRNIFKIFFYLFYQEVVMGVYHLDRIFNRGAIAVVGARKKE